MIFSFSSCRFNQIKWKKRNSFDYCLLVVCVSLERVVGFSKILFALFFFFRIVNVDASSPREIFFYDDDTSLFVSQLENNIQYKFLNELKLPFLKATKE